MKREKLIIVGIAIFFVILVFVAFSLKIDRSSVYPSHDKTLIIKNLTIGIS